MDHTEVLQAIKDAPSAGLDPDAAAEIFAHVLASTEIPEFEMHRLIMIVAAMYQAGIGNRAALQIPVDLGLPLNAPVQFRLH